MSTLEARRYATNLQRLRLRYGITQDDLARARVDQADLSRFERGKRTPNSAVRMRLAAALGVDDAGSLLDSPAAAEVV